MAYSGIDATAFRRFFELPGDEWKWHFDVPDFDVRFIALDLNHIALSVTDVSRSQLEAIKLAQLMPSPSGKRSKAK